MKHFYIAALCLLPVTLYAAEGQSDYGLEQDKIFAVAHITADLREQCLQDFSARSLRSSAIKPAGKLTFNEPISRVIYRTLYWKNSDRGVAFTLLVKTRDPQLGTVETNVACFYAVVKNGLEFQLSQPLPWRVL